MKLKKFSENSMVKKTFEEKMKNLDGISKELENPATGLSKSLEKYKEAMALIKECQDELSKAEGEVKIITEDAGGGFIEE